MTLPSLARLSDSLETVRPTPTTAQPTASTSAAARKRPVAADFYERDDYDFFDGSDDDTAQQVTRDRQSTTPSRSPSPALPSPRSREFSVPPADPQETERTPPMPEESIARGAAGHKTAAAIEAQATTEAEAEAKTETGTATKQAAPEGAGRPAPGSPTAVTLGRAPSQALIRLTERSWPVPVWPSLGQVTHRLQPAVLRDNDRRRDLSQGLAAGAALAAAIGIAAYTTRTQWLTPCQQALLPWAEWASEHYDRLCNGVVGFREAWHHGAPQLVVDSLGRPLPCRAVVHMDIVAPAWPR